MNIDKFNLITDKFEDFAVFINNNDTGINVNLMINDFVVYLAKRKKDDFVNVTFKEYLQYDNLSKILVKEKQFKGDLVKIENEFNQLDKNYFYNKYDISSQDNISSTPSDGNISSLISSISSKSESLLSSSKDELNRISKTITNGVDDVISSIKSFFKF